MAYADPERRRARYAQVTEARRVAAAGRRAASPEKYLEWRRAYYAKHRVRLSTYQADYQRKRVALARAFIDAAHADGCVDCGNKNLSVLQSDHVRGKKVAPVSTLVNGPLLAIFAELDKCETRCANCHFIATAARRKAA